MLFNVPIRVGVPVGSENHQPRPSRMLVSSDNRDLEVPSPQDIFDFQKSFYLPPACRDVLRLVEVRDHINKVRRGEQRAQKRANKESDQPYDEHRV